MYTPRFLVDRTGLEHDATCSGRLVRATAVISVDQWLETFRRRSQHTDRLSTVA